MSETAVVILNYNGSHFLRQFLPSVIQHSGAAKIVVADNGSTDDSLDTLQNFPTVAVISIGNNLGFCGGYNYALKRIQATYYVLLNSDIEVTPHWLQPVIESMEADVSIAAAQPKILSFHQPTHFEYAGAAGGFMDKLGYPFCRGRIFDSLERDSGQYNTIKTVFWATGACLFVRGDAFHRAGGLDEDFFAHMEEIDLCWKFHRMGLTIICQPASVVYHVGGGTLSKSNPRKTYLNFRNGLSILFKHTPTSELLWKFPVRIGLDWIAAIKFMMEGQFRDGGMVFKAHLHFGLNWRKEQSKRRALQALSYSLKNGIRLPKLLVFEYYVKGKRLFSQLEF